MSSKIFEVLTETGQSFRYSVSKYRWEFRLKDGSIDLEDTTTVLIQEIHEDGDVSVVHTINNVARVGEVTEDTALIMPREKITKQCPRCGYLERSTL